MAHAIVETEKGPNLQSASWRLRRADGISSSLGLSPKVEDGCPNLKTGRES